MPHPGPSRVPFALALSFVLAVHAMARSAAACPQGITFADTTAAAGIADVGISFGASAGDCDGDGDADLFTSSHYGQRPRLWRNNGNGTFTDVVAGLALPIEDLHAAQWIDLDNDGQRELVLMLGAAYGLGAVPKRVHRRSGGGWIEIAAAIGLDVPLLRGRTPLATDRDRDGLIDLFLTAPLRPDGRMPPSLYRQDGLDRFVDDGPGIGLAFQVHNEFGVLGDLDGDGVLDALFDGAPPTALRIGNPVQDITAQLGLAQLPDAADLLLADFTGDGHDEIYVATYAAPSSVARPHPLIVEFHAAPGSSEHTARFALPFGAFTWFDFSHTVVPIRIGAGGLPAPNLSFALATADPANHGLAPHVPGTTLGVFVGYDVAAGEWRIAYSGPAPEEVQVRMVSSQPVGAPSLLGVAPQPTDRLLMTLGGPYLDVTALAGLPPLSGCSAVAADFDNDMDLDLYVMTTTTTANTPNRLFMNLSGFGFVEVPAGAAVGTDAGVGDAVITLDYDRDGRVDLFSVNGWGRIFRVQGAPGAFADDGPAQLLRNTTANANHWLGIDLVGTGSNRDGIGARVLVTAGGRVQVREHGGGMHRYAQNHGIHFGLGANAVATRVEVRWPSGRVTVLHGVTADQVLTVVE
jgi:hypothetical protein